MSFNPLGRKTLEDNFCQKGYPLLILGFAFFCTCFFLHWREPLYGDECWTLRILNSFIQGSIPAPGVEKLYHQPLYGILSAVFLKMGGGSLPVIRLLGLLCHLFTAFLVFHSLKASPEGAPVCASLAGFLYLIHPLSIQSSLILDIDPVLLVPTGFFLFSALVLSRAPRLPGLMLAGFLAFSTKLTTPFPIAFIGLCTPLRNSRPKRAKKALGIFLGMAASLLFVVATASYLNRPWTDPLTYILAAFVNKSDWNMTRGFLTLLRSVLWFSPFLITLAAWAIYLSFKKNDSRSQATSLTLLTVFLAYLVIGGVTHGYLKYHLPLLPILFLLLGLHFCDFANAPSFKLRFWVTLIVLCSFLFGSVMPDPLLLVNYQLREHLAVGEPLQKLYFKTGAIGACLFLTPLIVALLVKRRSPKTPLSGVLAAALFVCTIGYSLGMDIRQGVAAYGSRYCYGETGTAELAALVRRLPANERALVPEHIQILAGLELDKLVSPAFWSDIPGVARSLENPEVRLFAYSVSYNTMDQIRDLRRDARISEILTRGFTYQRIGSFDTWQRK